MKVWTRPCDENCIVKAICVQPCPKLVSYANILLYEMALNHEVAIKRHPIVKGKFKMGGPMEWIWRVIDLMNRGNHVTIEAASPTYQGGLTPFHFNINKYEFLATEDQNGDEQEDQTV